MEIDRPSVRMYGLALILVFEIEVNVQCVQEFSMVVLVRLQFGMPVKFWAVRRL